MLQKIKNLTLCSALGVAMAWGIAPATHAQETGPYLGQDPPGLDPKVFAPDVISLPNRYEFGICFSADASELNFGVNVGSRHSEIWHSLLVNDEWTAPERLVTHEVYGYNDPMLTPDEQRLFMISTQPLDGVGEKQATFDIWYLQREGKGWSKPINAGPNINTGANEFYSSFAQDGALYFASNRNAEEGKQYNQDIYRAAWKEGAFQAAALVPGEVNTHRYDADVFVDPAEEYMIYVGIYRDGLGQGDLYISFKQPNGSWGKGIPMGSPINDEGHQLCPFVSRDGKYFFYTSKEELYWVSTEILERYKAQDGR